MLAFLPSWFRDIVLFALNTGMRQDEIFSLKWSEVDLPRKTISVLKSKNYEKRTIPLNDVSFNLLLRKEKVRAMSGLVFPDPKTGQKIVPQNVLWRFYAAQKRAGIPHVRFHDLRHTFATRLVQNGTDIYKVSKLLGHRDRSTTQRYAHHYPESLRDGVETLDNFYERNRENFHESFTVQRVKLI